MAGNGGRRVRREPKQEARPRSSGADKDELLTISSERSVVIRMYQAKKVPANNFRGFSSSKKKATGGKWREGDLILQAEKKKTSHTREQIKPRLEFQKGSRSRKNKRMATTI